MSNPAAKRCPDASLAKKAAWVKRQLEAMSASSIVKLSKSVGGWRMNLPGHDGTRRQKVFVRVLEDVDGAADLHAGYPEPCVHIVSPFLTARPGRALSVEAARRALAYSSRVQHARIGWARHPEKEGSAMLGVVCSLFLEDLDSVELESAVVDVAKHADKLESLFSAEDLE